ncbi:MAG: 4-(cytidine 5'-diphospho)-2-C-methyl-D-erythritol kinase [Lachnospiraceae bacterium]|nr:4-(cytidine 5'-diphospho)-2-C-methyl-D-erythritol kinase [Lachnospiraceae bacterium]
MRELDLKARAKINLGLDVLRKRPDGYHDLRMIMQTVNVYDRIRLTRTKAPGIRIATNVSFLPVNENNLVWKAAALLMNEFPQEEGIYVDLAKTIPVAAGLAGGSSDAAAVLVGMNRLFGLGLDRQDLMERGVRLGADVPYCILRGSALAEGIGEVLTPLHSAVSCRVVLAKPAAHVSTRYVYTNLRIDDQTQHPDIDGQVAALESGDLEKLCACMGNVLESVTIPVCPEIAVIKKTMLSAGAAGSMMSGSGPTVFGLFRETGQAQAAADLIREQNLAEQVFVTDFYFPK